MRRGRQLVRFAAAERGTDSAAANRPHDPRTGGFCRESGQRDDRGQCGMAATCDDSVLPGEPSTNCLVVEIGHTVGDRRSGSPLAEGGQSLPTERVRGAPGAGRIDDGLGEDAVLAAVGAAQVDGERFGLAAGVDDQVAATSGDADHLGVELHGITEGGGEGFEVELSPLLSGRVRISVGGAPPGLLEQTLRGGIDEFGPAGEEADVIPFGDRRAGDGAALEHQRRESSFAQLRGGGEADRSGSDHDNG